MAQRPSPEAICSVLRSLLASKPDEPVKLMLADGKVVPGLILAVSDQLVTVRPRQAAGSPFGPSRTVRVAEVIGVRICP